MTPVNSKVTLALLPLLTMTLLAMGCNDSTAPSTEPEASSENGVSGPHESTAIQPALAASVEDCPAGTRTPNLAWFREHFSLGPTIPSTNTAFVSQGLGYWGAKDWLITSLSEGGSLPNRIAIKNRSTGAFIKFLVPAGSDGLPLPGHMGGLSVSANNLWISTDAGVNHVVYRIPLSAVASTANSGFVRANHVWNVGASSYSTYYATGTGNYLYFGIFNPSATGTSTMTRYLLSSNEDIIAASKSYISTPTQVQGVTVADGYYIFSTSYGRQCYSRLQFKSISTGSYYRTVQIPPMSEGIVRVPLGAAGWADDVLYVNFESGSDKYKDAVLRTFYFYYARVTELTP
jgi:hypothetical protein